MRDDTIRFRGQRYPVIDRMRIGDRTLVVIERLGNHRRPTYQAVERGLTTEMRCVQVLPYSPETLKRLRLLSKISAPHASLPAIVDSRRQGDDVILLTRWIDGPTLRDYLRQCHNGREPWPSPLIVMNLIRWFVHGFRLLHDRLGVVHGDIHPGNLILCRHTKRLILIDFGSTWNLERSKFRPVGDGVCRAYAAPESQGGESSPGFRSDQFSTMSVCYEMLTGQVPYDGLGGRVSLANDRQDGRIELSPASANLKHSATLPKAIQRELDAAIVRSLAIEPNKRYEGTQAWLDALDTLAARLECKNTNGSNANGWLLRQISKLEKYFGSN